MCQWNGVYKCGSLLLVGIVLGSYCPVLRAGSCRHCNPCPSGAYGELFGFYSTNWRRWPTAVEGEPGTAPLTIPAPMPRTSTPPPEKPVSPQPTEKPGKQNSNLRFEQGSLREETPYVAPPQ